MQPTPLTLYCLPCAGGSAVAAYTAWRRRAPHWLTIAPVELPGRGARLAQTAYAQFDPLVALLADEIGAKPPGAYALFGHSFGALLAHGVARQLIARGQPAPAALVLACCAAPSARDDARYKRLAGDAALIAELRRLGGTPPEVFAHPELLRLTLDVIAADFAACADFAYREPPPIDVPLHVFGGADDDISAAELGAWRRETTCRAAVEMWPGGHFFFKEQEDAFLAALFSRLDQLANGGAQRTPSGLSDLST